MAKFVDTTWAACLARQKPVSTSAKPACMKITSAAPMTTHSRLFDVTDGLDRGVDGLDGGRLVGGEGRAGRQQHGWPRRRAPPMASRDSRR